MKRLLAASAVALALAGCNDQFAQSGKSLSPIPPRTMALMVDKGMGKSDPILVRLYKKESELEVWKKATDGRYALLKSFPICRWSGQLGPKRREGDRQAPEGFYTITPGQMNPNSAYYLSFNTGYPNAYDRAHGGTGSELMVHGTCSSRGCYAMTDEGISEVYALAREAFSGGQRGFQFQAYPFRMTAENFAKYRYDPNMPFWRNLKEGSDNFEVTKSEPRVAVCGGSYAFNTVGTGCTADPTLAPVVAQKEQQDRHEVAELIAKGIPAVKVVYADGGGHESFRQTAMAPAGDSAVNFALLEARPSRNLGDVSRPDALAEGPREVTVDQTGRAVGDARPTLAAAAAPRKTPAPVRTAEAVMRAAEAGTPTASGTPTEAGIRLQPGSRIVMASADASAAAGPPSAAEPKPGPDSKSLYDRMVGLLGPGAAPATIVPEVEPEATPAAAAPAGGSVKPPRRPATAARLPASGAATPGAVSSSGGAKSGPAAKPQASLDRPAPRHVAGLERLGPSAN